VFVFVLRSKNKPVENQCLPIRGISGTLEISSNESFFRFDIRSSSSDSFRIQTKKLLHLNFSRSAMWTTDRLLTGAPRDLLRPTLERKKPGPGNKIPPVLLDFFGD
jgi:hypothetical protein